MGFDWDGLAARRMDPPRKPKDTDSAKRKSELAEAHRAEPREPQGVSPQEMAEWERVFKDF